MKSSVNFAINHQKTPHGVNHEVLEMLYYRQFLTCRELAGFRSFLKPGWTSLGYRTSQKRLIGNVRRVSADFDFKK